MHQLDVFFSGDSPILSGKNHTLAVLKSDDWLISVTKNVEAINNSHK